MKNIIIGLIIIVIIGVVIFSGGEKEPEAIIQNEETMTDTETTMAVPAPGGAKDVKEMIVVNGEEGDGEAMEGETTIKTSTISVTYTDAGFSPSNIEINIGDTVIFTNDSGHKMWVASAQHPTHRVYSEFDDRKGIANGEIYEFVFEKSGTWGYHNHVRAGSTGKVVVK